MILKPTYIRLSSASIVMDYMIGMYMRMCR